MSHRKIGSILANLAQASQIHDTSRISSAVNLLPDKFVEAVCIALVIIGRGASAEHTRIIRQRVIF